MSFSNAIVTKSKVLFGERLLESDYKELVRKNTISEVVDFLKLKSSYQDTLKNVSSNTIHRGQLEDLLKENHFNKIIRLSKFLSMKDAAFYNLNQDRYEINIILKTYKMIATTGTNDLSSITTSINLTKKTKIDIEKLFSAINFSDLLKSISNTKYYGVLKEFENRSVEYSKIEQVLDGYYYQSIFKIIDKFYKGSLKKDLVNIFKTKIELININRIYRLKKFYNYSKSEIMDNLILIKSRMSLSKLEELIDLDDPNDVLKKMEKSEYQYFKDESEYVYVEYFSDKIKYNLARRFMYFSNKAAVSYYSYSVIDNLELENIINIIEGIRYKLDQKEIEKLLIY